MSKKLLTNNAQSATITKLSARAGHTKPVKIF